MSISSRSAIGVHVLALLARSGEEPLSSQEMSESVKSNPVVIRRVLGRLRDASLVTSLEGSGGGWQLVRSPEKVTLLDVYSAVEKDPLFSLHAHPPSFDCAVGRNIQGALEEEFSQAESAMEERLARTTIAEVLRSVLARAS